MKVIKIIISVSLMVGISLSVSAMDKENAGRISASAYRDKKRAAMSELKKALARFGAGDLTVAGTQSMAAAALNFVADTYPDLAVEVKDEIAKELAQRKPQRRGKRSKPCVESESQLVKSISSRQVWPPPAKRLHIEGALEAVLPLDPGFAPVQALLPLPPASPDFEVKEDEQSLIFRVGKNGDDVLPLSFDVENYREGSSDYWPG